MSLPPALASSQPASSCYHAKTENGRNAQERRIDPQGDFAERPLPAGRCGDSRPQGEGQDKATAPQRASRALRRPLPPKPRLDVCVSEDGTPGRASCGSDSPISAVAPFRYSASRSAAYSRQTARRAAAPPIMPTMSVPPRQVAQPTRASEQDARPVSAPTRAPRSAFPCAVIGSCSSPRRPSASTNCSRQQPRLRRGLPRQDAHARVLEMATWDRGALAVPRSRRRRCPQPHPIQQEYAIAASEAGFAGCTLSR